MKQLNIFCEGQTEQGFCVQVLQPHLFPDGAGIIHTLAVGEKDHHHLYGLGRRMKYERIRKFIRNTIKQREGEDVFFTTLFDLYALPADFPGKDGNVRNPANPTPYVEALELAFGQNIGHYCFIPYLRYSHCGLAPLSPCQKSTNRNASPAWPDRVRSALA